MANDPSSVLVALRLKARTGLQRGDLTGAEQSFRQLLGLVPGDVEAVQFLSARCLDRGETNQAVQLLVAAHQREPQSDDILHHLGAAQMAQGDFVAAAVSLKQCVDLSPHMFVARLRLGIALEHQRRLDEAVAAYFGAISLAQARGHWLSDATTAVGVREAVKHAMKCVNEHRRMYLDAILEPLRQRYGRSELGRVEQCLAIYLGDQVATLPDSRQAPKFMYFPGVPSQPYYPRGRFPWYAQLEASTAVIREELRAVLAQTQDLESFLQTDTPHGTGELLGSFGPTEPAWDAYFFYRHGTRFDEHCVRCPQTAALLASLPLARVRDHSPETLFSVLRPGSHILPHRGVTNTRLVTHLPLIVPPDCAIRVGGELHAWQEGRAVTFDDTFEHSAWNKSDETRVVLILDCWNPDLSEGERAAVSDLVAAIGDFNRAGEVPAVTG